MWYDDEPVALLKSMRKFGPYFSAKHNLLSPYKTMIVSSPIRKCCSILFFKITSLVCYHIREFGPVDMMNLEECEQHVKLKMSQYKVILDLLHELYNYKFEVGRSSGIECFHVNFHWDFDTKIKNSPWTFRASYKFYVDAACSLIFKEREYKRNKGV